MLLKRFTHSIKLALAVWLVLAIAAPLRGAGRDAWPPADESAEEQDDSAEEQDDSPAESAPPARKTAPPTRGADEIGRASDRAAGAAPVARFLPFRWLQGSSRPRSTCAARREAIARLATEGA